MIGIEWSLRYIKTSRNVHTLPMSISIYLLVDEHSSDSPFFSFLWRVVSFLCSFSSARKPWWCTISDLTTGPFLRRPSTTNVSNGASSTTRYSCCLPITTSRAYIDYPYFLPLLYRESDFSTGRNDWYLLVVPPKGMNFYTIHICVNNFPNISEYSRYLSVSMPTRGQGITVCWRGHLWRTRRNSAVPPAFSQTELTRQHYTTGWLNKV